MDLELSEDEAALRDNVRAVLAGICPPAAVRAVFEGKGDPAAIWSRMVDLDWPGLGLPEEAGGLGMGYVAVALVAEELGRAVAPGAFLATVTQFAPAVHELGGPTDLLARVAAGQVTGTVALAEEGGWEPAAVAATARETAAGWALAGTKRAVLDGARADEVLVIARAEGTAGPEGLGAFLVPGAGPQATPRPVIDPTLPLADLALDGVVVPPDRVLAPPGSEGVAEALDRAAQESTVALAATTVGACRVVFERTVEYAKVREQYGRPIGSFQALKHRMADMYLAVERATALCYFAALTIAEEDPRRAEAASMAKAAAGECQALVVQDGLQLHGGIGVTWENDLHFPVKRAITGDTLYGNAVHHRARLARMLGLAA
ncbi:MAG TPA: acyl-CoA dehydrogenase family protein [Acidimicrobiales bacterium]|jgi:alkylation response protein AidB-like acyl-CoA dehydrogenase